MSSRRPKILAAAATAVTVTLAVAAMPAHAADPDPDTPYGYAASAGGTFVRLVGGVVSSDLTSASGVSGATYPASQANTLASSNVGTLLKVGAISTQASADKVGTTITATSSAETADVSLLKGLIKVDAVKTVTESRRTGTVLTGDSDTELLGITINGRKLPVAVGNNTGVNIPGIASVVLNEKKVDIVGGKVTTTGSALKVTLLKGYEGSPIGTTVIVNPTSATLAPSVPSDSIGVGGYAFGTQVTATVANAINVVSGPTALISSPPSGTFGYELVNSTAAVNVPLLLKVGVVESRTTSTTSPTAADVTHSNRVAGVNLLSGLIRADAVQATSRAQKLPGGERINTPTTEIVNLVIAGKKIPITVAPNTAITIPGVARVVVNEQSTSATGNLVSALHVTLLAPKGGLRTGADIYVAVASSQIY